MYPFTGHFLLIDWNWWRVVLAIAAGCFAGARPYWPKY
jgi:hypothetical protein